MPIFKHDGAGKFLPFAKTPYDKLEKDLEDWIEGNPHLLLEGERLVVIARQPRNPFGKKLDLICIDETGAVVVVELKRGETPRDIIAQSLEYAAWVDSLSPTQLDGLAAAYSGRRGLSFTTVKELYDDGFADSLDDGEDGEDDSSTSAVVTFNNHQRIVMLAERITGEVEQTLRYLRTRFGADVYGIEFNVHKSDAGELLLSTETIVGREPVESPALSAKRSQEAPAETVARVKTPFLKEAVQGLEDWINTVPGLTAERAAGISTRRIRYKGTRWARYYFAAAWIYMRIFYMRPGELDRLRSGLADQSSIATKKGGVRFHIRSQADLDLFKSLFEERVTAAALIQT